MAGTSVFVGTGTLVFNGTGTLVLGDGAGTHVIAGTGTYAFGGTGTNVLHGTGTLVFNHPTGVSTSTSVHSNTSVGTQVFTWTQLFVGTHVYTGTKLVTSTHVFAGTHVYVGTHVYAGTHVFLGTHVFTGTKVFTSTGDESCGGKRHAGFCWYLDEQGDSCTQTCADHSGVHSATVDFIGSKAAGLRNALNCLDVGSKFSHGANTSTCGGTICSSFGPCSIPSMRWGCYFDVAGGSMAQSYCSDSGFTDVTLSATGIRRLCACQN